MPESERSLAVFIDFENLALGFQGRRDRFDIARVLERLVEKGKIVAKRAYADWSRFLPYTAPLHEAAIELVEIPRRAQTGKNSADIHLCVDAMDLAANNGPQPGHDVAAQAPRPHHDAENLPDSA